MSHQTVSPPRGLNSDGSVSAPVVGTVLSTFADNQYRKAFFVQNQSANDLQVVLDGSAAFPGTPTIIIIAAAASANKQGGYWDTSGFLHTGRIRICGTSGQFAAAELV